MMGEHMQSCSCTYGHKQSCVCSLHWAIKQGGYSHSNCYGTCRSGFTSLLTSQHAAVKSANDLDVEQVGQVAQAAQL